MASNYWESSHRKKWHLDRREVRNQSTEYKKSVLEGCIVLQTIAARLSLPQRAIATALIFFRRFCSRKSSPSEVPILVTAACIFIATKVEECPIHPHHQASIFIRAINFVIKPEKEFKVQHLFDMEFVVLEELNQSLVVFQGSQPLTNYLKDLGFDTPLWDKAFSVLNDTYMMDVWLYQHPHIIALACIPTALSLCGGEEMALYTSNFTCWVAELTGEDSGQNPSSIREEQVWETSRDILASYEFAKQIGIS